VIRNPSRVSDFPVRRKDARFALFALDLITSPSLGEVERRSSRSLLRENCREGEGGCTTHHDA
jgi:hypothetical protein